MVARRKANRVHQNPERIADKRCISNERGRLECGTPHNRWLVLLGDMVPGWTQPHRGRAVRRRFPEHSHHECGRQWASNGVDHERWLAILVARRQADRVRPWNGLLRRVSDL